MQQKYNYINYHYTVSQKNWATTINIINCRPLQLILLIVVVSYVILI